MSIELILIILGFVVWLFYAINYNKMKDKAHVFYIIIVSVLMFGGLGWILFDAIY